MTNLIRGDIGRFTRQFTCNGASNVTVNAPEVNANSVFVFGLRTVGGTVGAIPRVTTVTPGVSFTVAGTASDTSIYNVAVLS